MGEIDLTGDEDACFHDGVGFDVDHRDGVVEPRQHGVHPARRPEPLRKRNPTHGAMAGECRVQQQEIQTVADVLSIEIKVGISPNLADRTSGMAMR